VQLKPSFQSFSSFFKVLKDFRQAFATKYRLVGTDRRTKAVKSLRQIVDSIGTSLQACRALPRLGLESALGVTFALRNQESSWELATISAAKGAWAVFHPPPKLDCLDVEGTGTGTEY
jgi:hypothetical protein